MCVREDLDIAKMQDIIVEFKYMMDSLKNHYYKKKYLFNSDNS